MREHLRGTPYDLALEEVARRAREAWDRGATEVCMQGGINPDYTGDTYLELLRTVKQEVPGMHVHAFSPLEVCRVPQRSGSGRAAFWRCCATPGLARCPAPPRRFSMTRFAP